MNATPLRVLVVDDSPLNRRALTTVLSEEDGVHVVGAAADGDEALRLVASLAPDLVTLDLEMPRMDGFTFLRLLMASRPTPVVVVSSHSAKENVFRALELGAIDFVAKPENGLGGGLESLRPQLHKMVRVVQQLSPTGFQVRKAVPQPAAAEPRPKRSSRTSLLEPDEHPTKVVVIASSTGGPTALLDLFSKLPAGLPAAILVAQHMPDRFTKAFADRLDRLSAFRVMEADGHQLIESGTALVCPGGRCMEIRRAGARLASNVLWPDAEDRYAPSADRLFTSAARVVGRDVIGVVLTGMGDDGARGAQEIKQAGGTVLAESEETAVVYGMPKAAAKLSAVDRVLPLSALIEDLIARLS